MQKRGGGLWSEPSTNCLSCNGEPSIAVFDPNNIYIGAGDIIVAGSYDGQTQTWTWTQHTAPGGDSSSSLAVSSNGILNYAWAGNGGIYFSRTTKSHDLSRWIPTPVLALPGGVYPNLAVDSAGKAYIMATHEGGASRTAVFTKEK
ncbi:MAG: hypothetical protein HY754_08690 [Nitrospirae bacterium]|nr:hypothetical protein [Nitrospirota bacterium]